MEYKKIYFINEYLKMINNRIDEIESINNKFNISYKKDKLENYLYLYIYYNNIRITCIYNTIDCIYSELDGIYKTLKIIEENGRI